MFTVMLFMEEREQLLLQRANRRCHERVVPAFRPVWRWPKCARKRVAATLTEGWAAQIADPGRVAGAQREWMRRVCLPVMPSFAGFHWRPDSIDDWADDDHDKPIRWRGFYYPDRASTAGWVVSVNTVDHTVVIALRLPDDANVVKTTISLWIARDGAPRICHWNRRQSFPLLPERAYALDDWFARDPR